MDSTMKLSEVAAFLGRSIDMVRRYMNEGLLTAEKRGNQLFFNREEVINFAKSRGIHTSGSEVPQGSNFTNPFLDLGIIASMLPRGVTINITGSSQDQQNAKV